MFSDYYLHIYIATKFTLGVWTATTTGAPTAPGGTGFKLDYTQVQTILYQESRITILTWDTFSYLAERRGKMQIFTRNEVIIMEIKDSICIK